MVSYANGAGTLVLPAIATPEGPDASAAALIASAIAQREAFDRTLHQAGAILFRGFQLGGAEAFQQVAAAFCESLGDYAGGNSPRTRVSGSVFTATEYTQRAKISLHNEASYLRAMPRRILFYCDVAPTDRGQTPLADSRRIHARLPPELVARFESRRVKYINNMHDGAGPGRGWRDVFGLTDRGEVERRLEADGYDYAWKPDGGLRTAVVADAVARHPVTGEAAWINQAEQWHPSSLGPAARSAMASMMPEEDFPHHACFGDGGPLDETDLARIREAMEAEEVVFQWQPDDVLLCDNYLIMHGRQPFTGPRRILCALG